MNISKHYRASQTGMTACTKVTVPEFEAVFESAFVRPKPAKARSHVVLECRGIEATGAIELKSGAPDVSAVVAQLQEGARIIEGLVEGCREARFFPILASGSLPPAEYKSRAPECALSCAWIPNNPGSLRRAFR
jgi:hypothetical protein